MAAPPLPFWCHICEVGCHSAINLQTHFLGVRHRKLEGALKEHALGQDHPEGHIPRRSTTEDDPTPPSRPPRNLEEQLDRCRTTEPALGLEYVEEHRCPGKALKYLCTLCDCEEPTNNMFMHVVGSKHRLAYLTKHYPERARVPGKGSKLNKNLRNFAAEVEARDGRKTIRVVIKSRPSKRKIKEEEDEEATKSQGALRIGPYVDSSSEDTTADTPAPAAEGPSALFLELKKAHEELVKKRDQESTASTIGTFASNKELLEYLDKFEIASEDDVDFVLTVNERFTSALAEYQAQCETKTEATTKQKEIHRTEEETTPQGVCTAEQLQNAPGKHVPVAETNTLQVHPNVTACSKPVFYNPTPAWINAVPAPKDMAKVLCSNPAVCSAAASIAPPNKVENVIAYHNPTTPVNAIQPPNMWPKPDYYASTPATLPTPQVSPKVISENPVHYSYTPSAVPPPYVSHIVLPAKPVYYNSTPASVPPPKPSPVVISAKPVYYNITKASAPECKPAGEKVVKDTSAAVPVKKTKKRKI